MGVLADVRCGLGDNLRLMMPSYDVFDYEHKNPPGRSIVVGWPDTYDPRATMDATSANDLIIPVRIIIPWEDDDSSDSALEDAMDEVVAAIEIDRTLGGVCDDLACAAFTDIGARTMPNDVIVMTFTAPVEILA